MHTPLNQITGIIDIGSNTVRLSVYQLYGNGAYRVVDQGRWPARLSQRMDSKGALSDAAVEELAEVLRHFSRISEKHGASSIRAVATAAIRQAVNRDSIIDRLQASTGLSIEILSGEDEARIGSRAMLNSLSLTDGFVVDIGGGSTEISLIRNRSIVSAVSFPIGCVNVSGKYGLGEGPVSTAVLAEIQTEARRMLAGEAWISKHAGLPLVGLGGTVRALAKLHQRQSNYPFPYLHGYELNHSDLTTTLSSLAAIDVDRRRKLPGLSKDRGDVIVPGLAILLSVMQVTQASKLVTCGAGLRDGLFYETCLPHHHSDAEDYVLEESIRNLSALYPVVPAEHVQQVRKLAVTLYDQLAAGANMPAYSRRLLDIAARLFRIGSVIDFNDSADHTFYMLLHTHWNGLSHREMLISAAIASYRGANPLRRKLAPYRSMLKDGDIDAIARLGSLLQLAAALDRSESQAIETLELSVRNNKLRLLAHATHPLPVEQMEVENNSKEIKKNWGITPELQVRVR
ncbi:Ppx/GppA family phosphatase [Cohnella endophytica]|uniref:Ppx/GppA family phosphatase n=1 Tax=Cohnella endophytica TaxID=2419778 RepID=A0A494Y4V4_9BACL|nr:Ppx/GppA phosphatase family protein [Cohnella endophytica]RKP54960.1 Ppx/GppA family phosphatase [Cohnella endophytica]